MFWLFRTFREFKLMRCSWRRFHGLELLQLGLAVEHSWDVSFETPDMSAATALSSRSTTPDTPATLTRGATTQERASHNALLCPVCQLLSQARIGVLSQGSGVFLLSTPLPVLYEAACPPTGLVLTASAPRAPPFFL